LAKRSGIAGHSNIHVGKRAPTRARLAKLADALGDQYLDNLSKSDVYWDSIVSIEPVGVKQVYDLTIPETHNFVANDICVHNTALCLTLAQNAAIQEKACVAVFSLEMSKEQLVMRMLSSEAKVDAHRFRTGYLTRDEWARLAEAIGTLSEASIFIDDAPGISVLEMRAKLRRLAAEQKRLDLVVVDYLQLMSGGRRTESRQQEVSQISRELKSLAKELQVPVVALSQLSRAPEARNPPRPMMSDLRESGCLAGETLVTMADDGKRVPIGELVGQSGFRVWALNQSSWKLEKAVVTNAFCTGRKSTFRIVTRLGREILATANHKFLSFNGWKRLDEFQVGERIAIPRRIGNSEKQSMSNDELALLAGDVYWDQIVSIEPDGEADVFDLTVDGHHNFVADDFIVHNSIEQDADVVAFIYREDYYKPSEENAGIAEILIAKQRNGPTGTVRLAFLKEFTRFENYYGDYSSND
jgi:replicative DNA helicase